MKNIKKKIKLAFILIPTLFISWCINWCAERVCDTWFWDSDHCYQAVAIQDAEVDKCDKIKAEDFTWVGSNPPRDKCYMLIAENTGDLSACDKIQWWVMSYTREECILKASIANKNPEWCLELTWTAQFDCKNALSEYITVWAALDMDLKIEKLQEKLIDWENEEISKQIAELEKKRDNYFFLMSEDKKDEYEDLSDPLNREIRLDEFRWHIDKKTSESLLLLNNLTNEDWEKLDRKSYEAIRDWLKWKNDPKNDIELMDDEELLKLRRYEKANKAIEPLKIWKSPLTKNEKKIDQQLLFYNRMLEKQKAVDKWLGERQQDIDRELEYQKWQLKDNLTWKVTDIAKKAAFWELLDLVDSSAAWPTTSILWEAVNVVKDFAKDSEFRWLVHTYNNWMLEELANNNWDIDKTHEIVSKNLKEDPYRYEYYKEWITHSKYGNLIWNEECSDKNKNPLCINRDVFFKAMKKSYKYQNQ